MRFAAFLFALLSGLPLRAEPPAIVTDIAPVHSIVASVMDGVGAPELLFEAHVSPHHAALRPSQARQLSRAEVVIWMGPGLSPQLQGMIATLATDAQIIELPNIAGTTLLPTREEAIFEHDDHLHDSHDHTEGAPDPHSWLDPQNAALWARHVAGVLAAIDPSNAAIYDRNASQFQARVRSLEDDSKARLKALKPKPFVVLHDATQYFEHRFGLDALAAVASTDAVDPSAGRLAAVREAVAGQDPVCAFSEPQPGAKLMDTVGEGLTLHHGTLDPLGVDIPVGKDLYERLVGNMVDAVAGCFEG